MLRQISAPKRRNQHLNANQKTYDENIYDNLPPETVPAWREYV